MDTVLHQEGMENILPAALDNWKRNFIWIWKSQDNFFGGGTVITKYLPSFLTFVHLTKVEAFYCMQSSELRMIPILKLHF